MSLDRKDSPKVFNEAQTFFNSVLKDAKAPPKKIQKSMGKHPRVVYDVTIPAEQALAINDKNIKKIRFLKSLDGSPNILYLRFSDGHKESYEISNLLAEKVIQQLKAMNTDVTYTFARAHMNALDWTAGIGSHYRDKTYTHYSTQGDVIHSQIYTMKPKDQKSFNIIDLGCGDGSFLLDKISNKEKDAKWIGIDLSAENIKSAKAKCKDDDILKQHFIEGNMLDIINIMMQSKNLDLSNPVFVTSLGSMTRLVLPDAFIAAQALQEVYKIDNLAAVLGGGVGEPLITKHMAKRIGFYLEKGEPPHNMYRLTKLPLHLVLTNKLKKISTKSLLDLSLSPIPDQILKNDSIIAAIKSAKKPLTIDISHCKLTDGLITELSNILKGNKLDDITLVFGHSDKKQIDRFRGLFSDWDNHIQTFHITDDIALLGPKAFTESVSPLLFTLDTMKELEKNIRAKIPEDDSAPNIGKEMKQINAMVSQLIEKGHDYSSIIELAEDAKADHLKNLILANKLLETIRTAQEEQKKPSISETQYTDLINFILKVSDDEPKNAYYIMQVYEAFFKTNACDFSTYHELISNAGDKIDYLSTRLSPKDWIEAYQSSKSEKDVTTSFLDQLQKLCDDKSIAHVYDNSTDHDEPESPRDYNTHRFFSAEKTTSRPASPSSVHEEEEPTTRRRPGDTSTSQD